MQTRTDRRAERLVASVQRTLQQRAEQRKQQERHSESLRRTTRRMKDRQRNIDELFARIREIGCRLPALEQTLADRCETHDTTGLEREIQSLYFDERDMRETMNGLIREQQADKARLARH